jgi:glycosyltransferase involved in cell wall biosynthesis
MPEAAVLLSVVIPTFNRRELVKEAVESALGCCADDVEVIVVDDGSTDGTAQVLTAYADRIVVVHQANAGRSAARNAGVHAARGRYVCFLDSDDVWEPWHVAQFRHALGAQPPEVLAAPAVLWDPARGWTRPTDDALTFSVEGLQDSALVGTVLPLQGLFVSRDLFVRVGGFDEALQGSEDYVLLARLTRRASVVRLPRASVRIRVHPGRSMSDVDWDVTWRYEAADRLVQTLGQELTRRELALVRASSARYAAARLYEAGRMRAARAALREARGHLPSAEAWRATGRLWLQTWLGPVAGILRARRAARRVGAA